MLMGQPSKKRSDELALSKQDSKVGISTGFTKPNSSAANVDLLGDQGARLQMKSLQHLWPIGRLKSYASNVA